MDIEYINHIVNLLFVLLLIITAAFLLKRSKFAGRIANKNIKVISHFSIGAKEKLVLIEVDQQKILLGVTAHQIRTLHAFDAREDSPPAAAEFAEVLRSTVA